MASTVVVTLHQVDYAQKYCERAVALQDGEVFFDNLIHHLNEETSHHFTDLNQKSCLLTIPLKPS